MKTGPGSGFETPKPLDKPENYSPHTSVEDYSKFDVPKEVKVETVCEEAQRIVYGDREKTYGHPALNFDATARFWNAYMANKQVLAGQPVNLALFDAIDVARMMVFLKLARQQHSNKHDNLVDAIGYLACEQKIYDYEGK